MKKKIRSYAFDDIVKSIKAVGVEEGDVVFVHSNLGFFGRLDGAKSINDICGAFVNAIDQAIDFEKGSLFVPTFTYSFCNGEPYYPSVPKSKCGSFSDYISGLPEAVRSLDPLFSVAGLGKFKEILKEVNTENSFGKGSFWDHLERLDAKFLNFNFDIGSTYVHYVERELSVPYRRDKVFKGELVLNEKKIPQTATHFVRDLLDQRSYPDFSKLHKASLEENISQSAPLGRGYVCSVKVREVKKLISKKIEMDPYFLRSG